MSKLLTRDEFREAVFKRDNYKCVICKTKAEDSHHILDRKLFLDGGYVVNNGASVCASCHLKAEQTILSCDRIRKAAGIEEIVLPDGLDPNLIYDKWANIIHNDGTRTPGPMFLESGVQKILKPLLYLFRR